MIICVLAKDIVSTEANACVRALWDAIKPFPAGEFMLIT
jgi:hypothetical protein